MDYEVRIKGAASPDLDIDLASQQIAKVFNIDVEKAEKIITSEKEISLKKNLSQERADKMVTVLSEIGLTAVIYPPPGEEAELTLLSEPKIDNKPAQMAATPSASASNAGPERLRPKTENKAFEDDDVNDVPLINAVPIANGFTWVSAGFALMKQHPFAWIIASTAAIFINGILGSIPMAGSFLSLAAWPVLFGGLMIGAQKQAQGENFNGLSFLNGLGPQSVQLTLIGAAYLLVYGIVVGLMTGFIYLTGQELTDFNLALVAISSIVAPLLILFFAPPLVAINQLSAFKACKLSLAIAIKNGLPFCLFKGVLIVIILLGAVAFGIGILVSIPICIASIYAAYCDIFD